MNIIYVFFFIFLSFLHFKFVKWNKKLQAITFFSIFQSSQSFWFSPSDIPGWKMKAMKSFRCCSSASYCTLIFRCNCEDSFSMVLLLNVYLVTTGQDLSFAKSIPSLSSSCFTFVLCEKCDLSSKKCTSPSGKDVLRQHATNISALFQWGNTFTHTQVTNWLGILWENINCLFI